MSTIRRVLVVDGDPRFCVGASLHRGFLQLGLESHYFDESRLAGGWSARRSVVRRALLSGATAALNVALLTRALAIKPDLVVVMKGALVYPGTVEALRRAARRIVVFHTDDLENPLIPNANITESLPLFDVAFTTRKFALGELRARGARRASFLPFGFDPSLHHRVPAGEGAGRGLEGAVVFVGTWTEARARLFAPLAGRHPLHVWGGAWDRVPAQSPLSPHLRRAMLAGNDLRQVLASAGISVGLLRHENRDRHTMRTFEIPACAGFMLAERSEEHVELFEESKEAVFFEGPEEFHAQVERYLPDARLRRRIAEAGHRRLVADRHTYTDRARTMLEVVEEG